MFDTFLSIERENISRLMSYQISNGLHLWPLCRVTIAMEYMLAVNKLQQPHAGNVKQSVREQIMWLKRVILRNIFLMPRVPILILGTSVVNMKEGRTYTSRLYDRIKKTLGDAVVLSEMSYRKSFREPRAVVTFSTDLLNALPRVMSVVTPLKKKDKNIINDFIILLKELFVDFFPDTYFIVLHKIIRDLIKKYPWFKIEVFLLTKFKNIKAVIVEDGSYGFDKAVLFRLFRRYGVITMEHQHGLIAKNHPAYNYIEEIVDKKNLYHKYLPQYLVMFGDYWAKQASTPSTKIIWGFPYLHEKARSSRNTKKINILVISDGTNPELVLSMCRALIKAGLNKHQPIVVKLHPGEVPWLQERYGELLNLEKLEVKTYEPVYDLLPEAEYVIGFTSTVMIEAFAFGLRPYVYRTEYSRTMFEGVDFNYFDSVDELVGLLLHGNSQIDDESNISYYWAYGSVEHYKEFFTSRNILK